MSFDQELAENQRADRARMDVMLQQMIELKTALNHLRQDYDASRHQTLALQEQQSEILQQLTQFSARFVAHVDDEAAERAVLQAIAEKITIHTERISHLNRLLWAVIGACGIAVAGAVGWALNHVQATTGLQ